MGGGDDDLLGSRRLVRVLCWVGGGMMTILQETFALDLQLLLRDTLRRSRPCAWERSWTSAATTHARSATVELSLTLSCPKAYLSSEFKVFSPYISPAGFVEGWMVLTSRLRFALPLFFVVLDGAFHSPCAGWKVLIQQCTWRESLGPCTASDFLDILSKEFRKISL